MRSIDNPDYRLVFSVADTRGVPEDPKDGCTVRTEVRSLTGRQKEALGRVGSGRTWRMVSDEGP